MASRRLAGGLEGATYMTVYEWLARFRVEGPAGLVDRSSAARRRPHAMSGAWVALIELLRRGRLVAVEIAAQLPVPRSTVSAVLHRRGLARLRYLNPPPVRRYEWRRPGELVHVDTKKLGRIERASHRVTGNRRGATQRFRFSGGALAPSAATGCLFATS